MLTRAGESSSYTSSGDCGEPAAVGEEVEGPSDGGPASAWLLTCNRRRASVLEEACTTTVG